MITKNKMSKKIYSIIKMISFCIGVAAIILIFKTWFNNINPTVQVVMMSAIYLIPIICIVVFMIVTWKSLNYEYPKDEENEKEVEMEAIIIKSEKTPESNTTTFMRSFMSGAFVGFLISTLFVWTPMVEIVKEVIKELTKESNKGIITMFTELFPKVWSVYSIEIVQLLISLFGILVFIVIEKIKDERWKRNYKLYHLNKENEDLDHQK